MDLVEVFVDSVLRHSEFMFIDARAANRCYKRSIRALNRLSQLGDDGLSALANLLNDGRVIIRVTAASYLVNYRTEKALAVLTAAARGKDRGVTMLAIATLQRWENGIYLDPATGREVGRPTRFG